MRSNGPDDVQLAEKLFISTVAACRYLHLLHEMVRPIHVLSVSFEYAREVLPPVPFNVGGQLDMMVK